MTARRAALVGTVVATASVLTAAILAVGLVVALVSSDDPWRPLGPFPVQTVEAELTVRHGSVDLPAVTAGGTVTVKATKCYREPVAVSGELSWFSVDPPGLSLLSGGGANDFDTGCVDQTFRNQVPAAVESWAHARFAEGAPYVVVRITGRDVASRLDGEVSEPLTWRTQDFALVP